MNVRLAEAVCAALGLVSAMAALVAARELAAYPVVVEVETKSDWTIVTISGFMVTDYSILEGSGAPGLKVSASGSSISISKTQFDTTLVKIGLRGWLVFIDEHANVIVKKGDLEHTTVRVYTVVEGEERLAWSFTNAGAVPGSGGINPRSSLLPRSALASYPMKVEVKEMSVPRLVLAFYYPWYGNPQGASGRWFHWEKVSYREIGSATHYPLLGPYDSWDPRVVRSHIRMAKAAGVDGFIVSWWGPGTFEDRAFEKMLQVAAEEGFNLTIYYESVRELTKEQIAGELSYVLSKYSGHNAFLKIEGRPVIFVYAVEAHGRRPSFWAEVLREVERTTGVKAVYVADTFDVSYLDAFDGLHTYVPIWIQDFAREYAEMSKLVRSYVPLHQPEVVRRLWIATVNPGYDDRKIRRPGMHIPREDGSRYRRTWEAALASEPDMILICSWNEWHEGTEVEPSREYGFQYLHLTSELASSYRGWRPPAAQAPQVKVELSSREGSLTITLENVGEEPAVISQLTLVNAAVGASAEPANLYVYWIPVNSTTYAVFVPHLSPGESVRLNAVAVGSPVKVLLESWSASGHRSTAEASIEVERAAGRAPSKPPAEEGARSLLAAAGACAALASLAVAWRKLTRRSRGAS